MRFEEKGRDMTAACKKNKKHLHEHRHEEMMNKEEGKRGLNITNQLLVLCQRRPKEKLGQEMKE